MNRAPKAQASRVNITKYVNVATGKGEGWRFCPVVRSSNGRIRADYVLVMEERSFTYAAPAPARLAAIHRINPGGVYR